MEKSFCIYGAGGFAAETMVCLKDQYNLSMNDLKHKVVFMVDDNFYIEKEFMGLDVIPRSQFDKEKYNVTVAVGDPKNRKNMVEALPYDTTFATIIHPSVTMSDWVEIGTGSIITAGTILTCNISLGRHTHLNLNSTIGHDCVLGNFLTTAPGVNISGRCTIDERVYLGTGAGVRERISICSDVTVGMGAYVVKDITKPGTYVGTPAKLLS